MSKKPDTSALSSVFTSSMPDILRQLNLSLAVTTYQAGKVVLVRCDSDAITPEQPSGVVNTHFRSFDRPMGLAVNGNRLTIGGANTVWEMRNLPSVAKKLAPAGKHDACYLPRSIHITGDIDIHELGWSGDDELWLVNTRFCCLCTLDVDHSFYPRWRPHFVSALAPEDRCHLNGLAMVDGRPRYVTALGETDTEGGWRANKANGGILMDVDANEVILRGLSMPHSPRWYNGRLYVLESGEGALCVVDVDKGTWEKIAEVPGFTRGIDFIGPLAFIGLSKVRESATFSGIPIVSRLKERTCGVWVVNIETGDTIGFLRFESGVEEIFAVNILPNTSYPDMLEWGDPHIATSYVLPDHALADVYLPSEEELAKSPAGQFRLGVQLHRAGNLPDAIAALRRCIELQPDFPNARYSLGVALTGVDEFDEAAQLLEAAVANEPERADVHNSLGFVYTRLERPADAIACFQEAIEHDPGNADAHFNLGVAWLQSGDYTRGWEEYDWRWKTRQFTPFQCPHPPWDGSDIKDRTLLLHTEQGAGDAVQFARYIPLAAERCGKLIVVCQASLNPVFASLPGVGEVRQPGSIDVAAFDTWLPLMSLPRIFQTTLETIPPRIPYIDIAGVRRRKDEGALQLAAQNKPKIGIVWAGSPTHSNDRHRSCRLDDLYSLLQTPGLAFYSLQKGPQREELDNLPADIGLHDLDDKLQDYGDLVVVLDQLDLVITVDTSVAHVAGAMGKPVWVLLSTLADWRWGLHGDTTPWYPSMRLARQQALDDWTAPVTIVRKALENLVG